MFKYIDPDIWETLTGRSFRYDESDFRLDTYNLKRHWDLNPKDAEGVSRLKWPELLDRPMEETLAIAAEPWEGYQKRIEQFLQRDIPEVPTTVPQREGWWLWTGDRWIAMDPPSSATLVLDFESCSDEHHNVTYEQVDGSYIWKPAIAAGLMQPSGSQELHHVAYVAEPDLTQLEAKTIPFGRDNVVLNHNVSYDRSFLDIEYQSQDTGNRFWCSMSAFIACHGMSNQQLIVYRAAQKVDDFFAWMESTSPANLSEVHEHYFGYSLDKGVRDDIIDKGWPWVRKNLFKVHQYAVSDAVSTFRVIQQLWPEWLAAQPSNVSRYAQLLLGSVKLPLASDRWLNFYQRVETEYQRKLRDADGLAISLGQQMAEKFQEKSPQLLKEYRANSKSLGKAKATEVLKLAADEVVAKLWPQRAKQLLCLDWIPALSGTNKGMPRWYRDGDLKATSWKLPLLAGLTYGGAPVLYGDTGQYQNVAGKHLKAFYVEEGELRHPEKPGDRVSSMVSKGFVSLYESGALTSNHEKGIHTLVEGLNWKSIRKRIRALSTSSPEGYPMALPAIAPTGTITRRCADSLFQVLPNPKKKRLGSEFKSLIEAPYGYIIGADADSQEAFIAALFAASSGRSLLGDPFSTAVTWGTKTQGTDIHSLTATQMNVARDHAKKLIYGSIYYQGFRGAYNLLAEALPEEKEDELKQMANDFLNAFKGRREKDTYFGDRYVGGLASEAFNYMDRLANQPEPRTPFLGARMTSALAGIQDFLTSRGNWCVQSSGVDWRDMWVVLMHYCMDRSGLPWMSLMTLHDEYRIWLKSESTEDVAQAMWIYQSIHTFIRTYFIWKMGLEGCPLAVAYHESVDVDRVWRKSPWDTCETPTQEPISPVDQEPFRQELHRLFEVTALRGEDVVPVGCHP